MKVMAYLRRLGKERIIFIWRQSQKNLFENLKEIQIPVINNNQYQIIDFKNLQKNKPKISFESLKEAFDISNKILAFIW